MFNLQTIIDLVDRLSGPIAEPIRRIQELTDATAAADVAIGQLEAGMKIAALGLAIAAPLALATNEAIKFESAYAQVVKTVDFAPDYGPAKLSSELIGLSNKLPIAAVGFAAIAEEAGSAGIATKELIAFSSDAAKLGVAFDMTAQQAGDALGKLRINFKATQNEAMQIADATNYLSNVMASKAPDILNVLGRVGATAGLVGITGTELAALSSAMLSTGSAPEVVSTGLNAMIGFMGAATSQSKKFQNTLEDLGMSSVGLEKAIRTDAQGAILDLLKTVNASRNPLATLTDLFGREYADDIAKLSGNMGLLEGAFAHVSNTSKYAGSVQKEYAVQAATTANQLQLLKNRVQNVGIILGSMFLPPLNLVIGVVGDAIVKFQEFVQKHEVLGKTIMFVIGSIAIALVSFGLLMVAIGAIGFATAQARIGMVIFRAAMSGISSSATVLVGRLFAATFGVEAFALASLQGIGPMMMLRMVAGNLGLAFRALGTAMLANPIVLIAAAVIGLGAAFVWAWNHVEGFKNNVLKILQPLMLSFADLKGSFLEMLNQFGGAGDWIASQFGNLGGFLDALGYAFGFVLGFILTLVVGVFTRIATVITQALGGVVDIISGVVQTVVGLFTGDLDKARAGVSKIFQGILKIISAPLRLLGINWVKVQESLTAAWNWVKAFVPKMVLAGRDLILGLVNGIGSAASSVVSAVGDMANKALGKITGIFKINSPSRVFHTLGAFLSIGMANGIAAEAPTVYAAMQSLNSIPALESSVKIGTQIADVATPNLPNLERQIAYVNTSIPSVNQNPLKNISNPLNTAPTITPQFAGMPALNALASVTPQLTDIPTLNTLASVTPQITALPQLETMANVTIPDTQFSASPQIAPLSTLETLARVKPQFTNMSALPQFETIADVTVPNTQFSASPQIAPVPTLETFASVTPQFTNMSALPQFETMANVTIPDTQLSVSPQVAPVPTLETLANVAPQFTGMPTLNTSAAVTPQIAALPQLETMANVTAQLQNIPDLLRRDLNLMPKVADFSIADKNLGLQPLLGTIPNAKNAKTRPVRNVSSNQSGSNSQKPSITIEGIQNTFTFKVDGRDVRGGELSEAGARRIMKQIEQEFPSMMQRVLQNWASEVGYEYDK
jgi:TP901 family phage tail tape measure protein